MLVFGFLSVSTTADGKSVVDSQGDIISTADLEKSAYDYMAEARHVGVDHQKTRGIGRVVESCMFTPEKLKAWGLPAGSMPEAWWVGYKVDDPAVWSRVKSGDLSEMSWGGWAKRTPLDGEAAKSAVAKADDGTKPTGPAFRLTDMEFDEGSLVGKAANPLAKVILWKRAQGAPGAQPMFQKTRAILKSMFGMSTEVSDGEVAPPSTADVLARNEWMDDWYELRSAFETSVNAILCAGLNAQECAAKLQESTQQFLDALTALNAGESGEDAAQKSAGPDLNALDAALSAVLAQGITATLAGDITKTLDVVAVATEKKEHPMAKTAAEVLKSLSAEDRALLEATQKSAPVSEEITKRLDAMEKASAELVAKNAALEKQNIDLGAELLTQKTAAKNADKANLVKGFVVPGLDHGQMVDLLMKSDDGTAEVLLKSWAATTKSTEQLMQPVGSAGVSAEGASPAEAELAKSVAELQAKGMSATSARSAAMKSNPALAKRIGAELRQHAGL